MSLDEDAGRRNYDHFEPCGAAQVLQSQVIDIKQDVAILFKRVDRLPVWAVAIWGVVTAALGSTITAIYFLLQRIDRLGGM